MSRVAVAIGVSDYSRESKLPCCLADADAIHEFIKGTSRFDVIEVIKDATASEIRTRLREVLPPHTSEVFFYFSGHGSALESESFLCASDFDSSRPNETGISRLELLGMLRSADPDLVVMVIDACHSGSALIKSSEDFVQIPKGTLKNVIQIAACLEDQVSFTGRPLSSFTEKFLLALVKKKDGSLYYSDVINTLRDDYRDNVLQTPFFVQQGPLRDLVTDDVKQLAFFKVYLEELLSSTDLKSEKRELPAPVATSIVDRLARADDLLVKPGELELFINGFFEALSSSLSVNEFGAMYDISSVAHSSYSEASSLAFITRSLAGEARPDRFVSAETKYKRSQTRSLMGLSTIFMDPDERILDSHELVLNYDLQRAQMKFILFPKFLTLQQIVLVVSCAPSLARCYIFEVTSQHARTGFEAFETSGKEVVRRWYKRNWASSYTDIIDSIKKKLSEVAQTHIDAVVANLNTE